MPSLNATPGICRGCISSRCPLIHDTGFYRGSTASEAVMLLCLTFLRNSFPSVIQWDANPVWCFLAVRDVWVGFWLHSVRFSHQSECSCASLDLHKRFCEPALAWCLCQAVLLFLWWHNRKHFWAVLHSGFSVSMFSCHRRCPGTRDTPPPHPPRCGPDWRRTTPLLLCKRTTWPLRWCSGRDWGSDVLSSGSKQLALLSLAVWNPERPCAVNLVVFVSPASFALFGTPTSTKLRCL